MVDEEVSKRALRGVWTSEIFEELVLVQQRRSPTLSSIVRPYPPSVGVAGSSEKPKDNRFSGEKIRKYASE